MSNPSIIVGNGRWAVKPGGLLGYRDTADDFVVPIEFAVTRSASNVATRVNAAGFIETVPDNVPRLDYPLGGISAGNPALLVEPAATNLHTHSEAFASNYTTVLNLTPSGTNLTAPDNTSTADRFFETTTNDVHIISIAPGFGFALTSGTVYTFSVFAQSIGGRNFRLNLTVGGSLDVLYTLSGSGSVSNTSVATIQNYGNNWYRCTYTFTATSSVNFRQNIYSVNGTTNTFIGDVTKGFIVWGAQLETGPIATSYIPTTTGSVTRNADVISLTGVAGLIGQTEGTIYWEGVISRIDRVLFSLAQGTSLTNFIYLQTLSNGFFRADVLANNSSTCAISSLATATLGQFYKIAFAYKENDFALYINGVLQGFDNLGALPTGLSNAIFARGDSSLITDQRCRALELYPTRLPNVAQPGVLSLQSLTTI